MHSVELDHKPVKLHMQEIAAFRPSENQFSAEMRWPGPHERLGRRRDWDVTPLWPLNLNQQTSMIAWLRRCYEIDFRKMYIPYGQKLERRKNLYLTGRSSLPERRVGATGSKAASAILDLSIAARKIAKLEFRVEPRACDHTAS